MQPASLEYKEMMRRKWRNPLSHLRVSIGMINQQAQASAEIPNPDTYAYYSNLTMPLDNYPVKELYAVCDENYTVVDGSMYFLPRNKAGVVLNQGIVTDKINGIAEIRFPAPYDIKGLTVDFGRAYPINFRIESDNVTVDAAGNDKSIYVTEKIFEGTTFLRIVPTSMSNGQSRLRINQISMGIGIYFDSKSILSATKKEHISPTSEELPTIDFEVTVDNKNRSYDIENVESSVNFLEIGQNINVYYGQAMDNGKIEWMPGTVLGLREWSADDATMVFRASDCFDGMDGTYYKGKYNPDGVSLYDLALDVLVDARIDARNYWIDPYLKDVLISNPIPAVAHKAALQLIANAGRCILYQDRAGRIIIRSSFVPDMSAKSDNAAYFSDASTVLNGEIKEQYALTGEDCTHADGKPYFLPRKGTSETYLSVGYVSDAVSNEKGEFEKNPSIEIEMEAAFKCFGLTLEFGQCYPGEVIFHSYYDDQLVEDYKASGLSQISVISHEFPSLDYLVIEFSKGSPNNRVVLNNITFGDSTDYRLDYGVELVKTPVGTQLSKVRELQIVRTLYTNSLSDVSELVRENLKTETDCHTFYFTNPSYDLSAFIVKAESEEKLKITEESAYYATVDLKGKSGDIEVVIKGKEYAVAKAKTTNKLNLNGTLESWENPLVSEISHANDLSEWIGDYLKSDREYSLQYCGEPRLDANDIAFLENKYISDMLIRVSDHTLKYNGALSGTIKARRDLSYVDKTKN